MDLLLGITLWAILLLTPPIPAPLLLRSNLAPTFSFSLGRRVTPTTIPTYSTSTNPRLHGSTESGQFQSISMVCLNAHPSFIHSSIHPSILPSFMSHLATSHFLHPFHLVVSADSKPLKEAGSQALGAVFRSRGCSRVLLSSPNRCSTVHPPTGHWFLASWNTSHDPLFVLRKTTHLFSKKGARHSAPEPTPEPNE